MNSAPQGLLYGARMLLKIHIFLFTVRLTHCWLSIGRLS